ncbi:hypothetical protein JCM16303_000112, partial [Sporobolomyces ruberrimus]
MLVQTAFAISLAALATAAPLQEGRRSIDFSKKSDIVNTDISAALGKHSGADVSAVVSKTGDITADVDAKLGHLLGLDANVSLGLGRLLKGLLGGLLGKRDLTLSIEELVKRGDIVNADVSAALGKHSGADVSAIVSKTGDITADVDAKLGHLLGLDANVSLGLGRLLKGLLGGLLGKREYTSEELYKRANDDLVDVTLDSTIGHKSHANVDATVAKNLDIAADVDAKLGHLLGLKVDAGISLSSLLKGLLGIHKRALIDSATAATIDQTGVNAGSYVASGSSVAGVGLLSGKNGIDAGLITQLGDLLSIKVDAQTTPILRGILAGLGIHKRALVDSATAATIDQTGVNAGSYVASGSSVAGVGLLSGKNGIDAGLIT